MSITGGYYQPANDAVTAAIGQVWLYVYESKNNIIMHKATINILQWECLFIITWCIMEQCAQAAIFIIIMGKWTKSL